MCTSQHEGNHVLKFTNDMVIVSNGDTDNSVTVSEFTNQYEASCSEINVCRTKETVIDFGTPPSAISSLLLLKISPWTYTSSV